jgi:hypothetical protein
MPLTEAVAEALSPFEESVIVAVYVPWTSFAQSEVGENV